ncbi:histidine phosphatase family protein [Aspergillus alliaceus]|uniref:histidine phosphatase family protein n=1 Tax=Petromyces alliaceus TaxID=209559 RepID=UPI0012A403FC|nr:histidine phosphatase superfamily [Aspergillus alliaceus]KAB8235574.1 histidine phosphatase superfamily [Aspergillus alliaceus]
MHRYLTLWLLAAASCASAASQEEASKYTEPTATSAEPNWFQTRPQSFQGPTATGVAPFLALTNPAPFGYRTYLPNHPIETSQPIPGARGRNAFHSMGNLSPYHSDERGFGVDEYPRPVGSNITQMHMLHRHGSRYPSTGEALDKWAKNISFAIAQGTVFTGPLAFLTKWSYPLGAEILVPNGRQELFDSGVLNYFNYGALYNNNSKIVVRTTTQDRMLKSAENFLSGFFGLEWTENAKLLAIIEETGFNNSLASMNACPGAFKSFGSFYTEPMKTWKNIYLENRTRKLRMFSGGYNWTVEDSFNAQLLCAYETVSIGYSSFCQLFNYEEWEGFAYAIDITFNAVAGFQCPTGRAQGITWVEEFIARVEGRPWDHPADTTVANVTLNTNPITFPLNQSLYLDFTHDNMIVAVLTAFGFKQFSQYLPPDGPPRHQRFHTSQVVPFAARMNIEIIKTPHKVNPRRSHEPHMDPYLHGTGETTYVHFLQNQRTLPLHRSFRECEYRSDGWCELSTFLKIQKRSLEKAKFKYSCRGNWTVGTYGDVTDGVPFN